MNARALLLSLVTGLGHVYLRHYVLGAVLFALFATALNGIFLGSVIESNKAAGQTLVHVSVPAAIVIWVIGLAHAYKLSYGTDRVRLRDERQRLFREGLIAYLRDELDSAALALGQAVERDVDWEENDFLFHLGVVELRRAEHAHLAGHRKTAERARQRGLKAFRSCLARDERKKWRAEIDVERVRAHNPPRPMTRVLMAVPKVESSEDSLDDDTAELSLPKSGEGLVAEREHPTSAHSRAEIKSELAGPASETPAPSSTVRSAVAVARPEDGPPSSSVPARSPASEEPRA